METHLDYSISDPQQRNQLVAKIIQETPPSQLTPHYLEILSNYIIFAMQKEEKKKREILTDNRLITINKRQTSYQGLAQKLQNGQDGIYNMLSTNGKNTILSPKISITQQDLIDIPEMKQLQQLIKRTEMRIQSASGKNKYILKKHLIELRQQQYILKNAYKPPIVSIKPTVPNFDIALHFQDDIEVTPDGHVINHGTVSLFNPEHICAILCHYGQLRANCENNINSDCWTLLNQLDHFIDILREKTPFYYDIIKMKTDNKTNEDIQKSLNAKYGYTHSIQYLSSLWRNKIPKMLAEIAEEEYVSWYYTEVERGKWKRCNRCGCVKLANNRYFSKNKGSRDGLYSICKQCRNQSVRKKNADKNI